MNDVRAQFLAGAQAGYEDKLGRSLKLNPYISGKFRPCSNDADQLSLSP